MARRVPSTTSAACKEDQGQYPAALQSHQQALALFRELGDRDGEAATLNNIGSVQEDQGQYPAALQSHQQALARFRQPGVLRHASNALTLPDVELPKRRRLAADAVNEWADQVDPDLAERERDKLRSELIVVDPQKTPQDVRITSPSRRTRP